jgi:hypothetical protein
MSDPQNPYAAPPSDEEAATSPPPPADPVAMRREYWRREAAVKSIGLLCYLIAGLLALPAAQIMTEGGSSPEVLVAVAWLLVVIAVAVFLGFTLRRLTPWSSTVAVFFCILLLCASCLVPFVFPFLLYCLCVLFAPRGQVVFSPNYKEALCKTPHMDRRVSYLAAILFVPLGGLFVLVVGFVAISCI